MNSTSLQAEACTTHVLVHLGSAACCFDLADQEPWTVGLQPLRLSRPVNGHIEIVQGDSAALPAGCPLTLFHFPLVLPLRREASIHQIGLSYTRPIIHGRSECEYI